MNIKLYRQKKKKSDGKWIYQGQDSHPYADGDILIIADGLGGRGGFPHTKDKIDHRILDKNEIYSLLFGDVFVEEVDEDFKSFVVNNFEEIFATANYYFESDETVRRSGYFASRIITAIALHELKYNPEFDKKSIFDSIEGADENKKDEVAMHLGARLAKIIGEKLAVVAKRGGFELEVSNKGAYLLPSTLTIALMNEREEDVEVLYLWAGDSRGYIWDEKDGMGQVTEDHEQDETMTNTISLSRDFTVEGRFLTVKKPCVIFNASDGVYKPPVFACPIDQEYIFLLAISSYDDEASAMSFLENRYNGLSPDDSSTLALKAFGYDTYEELKAAVARRLDVINEKYVEKLPGIFDVDYASELLKAERPLADKLDLVADDLIRIDGVYELVRQDMINKSYAPYFAELEEVRASASAADDKRAEVRAKIKAWVEANWVCGAGLRLCTSAKRACIGDENRDPIALFDEIEKEKIGIEKEYKTRLNEIGLIIHSVKTDVVNPFLSYLKSLSKALEPESAERIDGIKHEMMKAVEDTFSFVESVCNGENEFAKRFIENREKKQRVIAECVEQDAALIEQMVESIISNPDGVSVWNDDPAKLAQIAAYHSEYGSVEDGEAPSVSEEDIARKHAAEYWRGNKRLYGLIWNSHRELIPEELIKALIADDEELMSKRDGLVANIAERSRLYEEYNNLYYRNYRESRI